MIAREKLNPVIPMEMGIQHGLNPSPFVPGLRVAPYGTCPEDDGIIFSQQ
jgi:hypothetical protein